MSETPEVIEQSGPWFADLRKGIVCPPAPGRTVSEADNTFFSMMTMDPQSLHLDAEFSSHEPFGQRLVNCLLTISILVGLSVGHLTQGTIVANLGSPTRRSRTRPSTATPSTGLRSCSTTDWRRVPMLARFVPSKRHATSTVTWWRS